MNRKKPIQTTNKQATLAEGQPSLFNYQPSGSFFSKLDEIVAKIRAEKKAAEEKAAAEKKIVSAEKAAANKAAEKTRTYKKTQKKAAQEKLPKEKAQRKKEKKNQLPVLENQVKKEVRDQLMTKKAADAKKTNTDKKVTQKKDKIPLVRAGKAAAVENKAAETNTCEEKRKAIIPTQTSSEPNLPLSTLSTVTRTPKDCVIRLAISNIAFAILTTTNHDVVLTPKRRQNLQQLKHLNDILLSPHFPPNQFKDDQKKAWQEIVDCINETFIKDADQ